MVLPGHEVEFPGGHLPAQILPLVALDQPPAQIADVHLLPLQLPRPGLDVRLDIVQQPGDVDLLGDELHLFAVAEAELQGGTRAGRLGRGRLQPPPVAGDLLEPVAEGLFALCVGGGLDGLAPILRGPRILPAVLEYLGQADQGIEPAGPLFLLGHLLVQADKVELVGQLETPHAGGQPGYGLGLLERMQRVGAAGIAGVVGGQPAEMPAVLRKRLHAELAAQEIGQLHAYGAEAAAIGLGRLDQAPSPPLAVAGGLGPTLRDAVIHRRAVLLDRRAPRLAPIESPPRLVVGQRAQVGKHLQAPGLVVTPIVQQHLGQVEVEAGHLGPIGVLRGTGQGLVHQLQRAHTVALRCVHHLAAPAMRPPLEPPRNQKTLVRDLHVIAGRSPQQPPIALMDLDDRLAEIIDLAHPIQPLEALRGGLQV